MAEYEKTIAQMIGKVLLPGWAFRGRERLPQPSPLSHHVLTVYSPSQRMSRGQT